MPINKTIMLSETDINRFNNACRQVVPEFANQEDGSVVFEQRVEFPVQNKRLGLGGEIRDEDGAVMDIQVITCEQDTCYVMATLYINGALKGRTDGTNALDDTFVVGEYAVTVKKG